MVSWDSLEHEYKTLLALLNTSGLDHKQRSNIQRRSTQLAHLLALREEQKSLITALRQNQEAEKHEEGELRELFVEERSALQSSLDDVTRRIEEELFPDDPRDKRSVFLEIRAGAGGQEAALFVANLFGMYANFALEKGWKVAHMSSNKTTIGGYKELIVHVTGKNVYKYLKFESGVHRVQRVPETETQGRVHTSTVTVAVMPEAEEVDITIRPEDLRIDVFRSQGAGGQSVNTTDSAVRIVHIPTNVVVTCQDERSQIKNKAKALKVLRARLYEAEQQRIADQRSAQRKEQVGSGQRSEKIRTYNFPQNRVTDHRINLTIKKLDRVIQGDLDDLLNPLISWSAQMRREQSNE